MAYHGFTNSEKAHCLLWTTEGYGYTAIKSFVRSTKRKHELALALDHGMKNTKLEEVILTGLEMVAHE